MHARGKTLPDLTEEFATGIGIVERDPSLLVEAVRRRGKRLHAVVDALDESPEASAVARDLLRPLSALPNVRLVVGTRRRLCKPLGPARVDLDLDDPANQDEGEIGEYVARMLLAGEDPGVPTPYRGDEQAAGRVAGVVAEKARGNYLIALLLSQDLIARPARVSPEALVRDLPETVGDAFEAFLQRFGEREQRFKELLRPLAYAQGNGLPDRLLWTELATELSGHTYGLGDIDELLTSAGDYVVEEDLAEVQGPPRWAYRLFHEAFAEHLRLHQDEHLAHGLIAARLAGWAAGGGSAWFGANAYIRSHLATHAAKGGLLDQLLADPGYLLAADTGRLLPALAGANTAAGRSIVGVVRRTAQHLQACALEEAASYLEMQARQSGLGGLADQVAELGLRRPWATPWAQWRRPAQRQRLAPDEHITAMTLAQLHGETIAVLATELGQLQFRRLSDGSHARDPVLAQDSALVNRNPRDSQIHILAAAEADGQAIVVSADGFGVMRTWNLSEEPAAVAVVYEDRASVVSLALTEIAGIPAVVSVDSSKVRCWKWADGTQIGDLYKPENFGRLGPGTLARIDQTDVIIIPRGERFDILTLPGSLHADNSSAWYPYPDERTSWLRGYRISEILRETRSRDRDIDALAAFPTDDTGLVVFGDSEGYVWAWSLHGSQEEPKVVSIGRHESTLNPQDGVTVTTVAIGDASGQLIVASGDYWGRIRVWNVSNSPDVQLLQDFATGHDGNMKALAVTDIDGDPAIVSHSDDGIARVWNLQSAPAGSVATIDECSAVIFAELDSTAVLLIGDLGGAVQILRVADGFPAAPPFRGPPGEVTAIAVGTMNDQPIALSGGYDGTVQVWDPVNGQVIGDPYTQHEGYVTAIAVTQLDGRLIAASGGSAGQLRIWDVATRAPLGEPINLRDEYRGSVPLGGVAFVHIDQRLTVMAAADYAKIQAWDVLDRVPVGAPLNIDYNLGAVTTIQVGTQPMVVFSDRHGVVRVRSFADSSVRFDLSCYRPLWCRGIAAAEFDGDPIIMAGGRSNGMIDIWNIQNGEQQRIDVGAKILALAAGPHRTLAIGTDDGVALVQFRTGGLNSTG